MKKKLSKNETHLTEKQMYDFYFYYYYAFCVCVCTILLSCLATGITRPLGLGEVPFFFNMLSVFFRCYLV